MRDHIRALKIGVLMGGASREREVSLRSGNRVVESLENQGLQAVPIDVDEHVTEALKKHEIDLAFIALHGRFGEDGAIQGLLEILGIPYTGSGVLASATGMNKVASKRVFDAAGITNAPYSIIDIDKGVEAEVKRIATELGLPVVVKPLSEGSSIGVRIAADASELDKAIRESAYHFGKVFAEKLIRGREVTVGILGTNGNAMPLPVLELRSKNEFYDYKAKYTEGMTEFICPAEISHAEAERVQAAALAAHRALGCRGLSRVDAIIDADGQPWLLEANTIPGLTSLSDLPAQAAAAGMSFDDLIFEIVKAAYVDSHPKRV